MEDRMSKGELLQTLQATRAAWDALLAEVGPDRMSIPGAAGKWRVQDIVAHITWGERQVAQLLRRRRFDMDEPLWQMSTNDRNEAVFQKNANRPLTEIMAEARQAYQDLLDAIHAASDEDLNDPARYPGMPETWRPWQLVVGNSYRHYLEHSPSIRAWLDAIGKNK